MPRGRKILIGVFAAIALICGLFAWFVNWSNSDAGQQAFREAETQQAVASATAESISAAATAAAAHAEEQDGKRRTDLRKHLRRRRQNPDP